MPCYKVTYFNVRARAELTRLVFAAAGQEFEDIRVDREAWQKMKPCKYGIHSSIVLYSYKIDVK